MHDMMKQETTPNNTIGKDRNVISPPHHWCQNVLLLFPDVYPLEHANTPRSFPFVTRATVKSDRDVGKIQMVLAG